MTDRNRALSELNRANARALAGSGLSEGLVLEALNRRHLAVLEEPRAGGAVHLHVGHARHGTGRPLCTPAVSLRESLGAFRSPYFSPRLRESQRIWCAIVWLEQNRGCSRCIELAYAHADEQGWKQPRRLGELLAA
jgi:hypothetical protein